MGVDLTGGASFSPSSWRSCLDVAAAFGWEPAGTIPPSDIEGEWDGSYLSNSSQSVTDADARELARALFRALNAVWTDRPLSPDQAPALKEAHLYEVTRLANHVSWRIQHLLIAEVTGARVRAALRCSSCVCVN
jgi:hypothetical protein